METSPPPPGTKQLNLKKSFGQAVRSLLTAVTFEDFISAFPRCTGAQRERLYQLYIQVITSLHENMLDEFESLCNETQVGTILDKVEDLVDQQSMDPISSLKPNPVDVKQTLLDKKTKEIHVLKSLLEKAENEKMHIRARILERKSEDASPDTTEAIEKFKSSMANYASYGDKAGHDFN